MALSDKKQVTLTKQELLVLEELMADYANQGDTYSFAIGNGIVHSEKLIEELFFKLESARFSK